MIEFKQTHDWEAMFATCDAETDVTRLFDDPRSTDREGMIAKVKELAESESNLCFQVIYDGKDAGWFMLYGLGGGCFETHIVLRKNYRGLRGIRIGKEGTKFSLSLPNVKELVCFCPEPLKESFVFALAVGWKSLGKLQTVWLKNGVEYPIYGAYAERGIA